MSKPSLTGNDNAAEDDHVDRLESLDAWHAACWHNFRDSDAFEE